MATVPKKPDILSALVVGREIRTFPPITLEGLKRSNVKPAATQAPSAEEIQANKARQHATRIIRERIYTQFPDLKPDAN